MSHVEKNFDRLITPEFWFGGTEIKVTDVFSGETAKTRIEFSTQT
jgi:hypothetical protein